MAAIDEFTVYYFNPMLEDTGQKLIRAENHHQAAINFNLAHPDWEIDTIESSDVTPEGWNSRAWDELDAWIMKEQL